MFLPEVIVQSHRKRLCLSNMVRYLCAVLLCLPLIHQRQSLLVQKYYPAFAGDLGFREGRERVYKILDRFQGKKPVVDIERAVYFTESMKQTEGKILVLRWALAMKNVAEKMTV